MLYIVDQVTYEALKLVLELAKLQPLTMVDSLETRRYIRAIQYVEGMIR